MIPTPDQRLRVFVSSTLGELAVERAAVRDAIQSMRLIPVMFEGGARDHPAEDVYREYLRQSDVFVAIYWQSYGWPAPGRELSGLEDELRLSEGMPRLIYVKEPAPDRDDRLARMIEGVRGSGVATKDVRDADDLGDQIRQDLAILLSERFSSGRRVLPTGTVTFLFADVEGSTRSLEVFGEAFADVLRRFRTDTDAVVRRHGGTLIRTEGDGTFAVFTDPGAGIAASVEAQRRYLGCPEPGPLKVRMGLHTGIGVVVDDDYVGLDVHRAARVADAAHGGQILVSGSTHELVGAGSDGWVDLGWFHLEGLSRPEHLFQVMDARPAGEFRPRKGRALSQSALPRPPTPTIGREAEIEEISRLLEAGTRLLTLTGAAGIGKTRIALEVGARMQDRFLGGVGFVDLAAVSDPGRVAETIAIGLGRSLEGAAGGEDVIVDELRDRDYLLILDNFEQVTGAAPLLAALLERLPRLQALVTSRTSLRLSVERERQIAPLGLPQAEGPLGDVASSPAIRLLLERARSVRPDIALTPDSAPAFAGLVRRLDGIPLAIELAAARLRLLGPADVIRRLDSAFDLGSGPTDLPDRQRTLRSAIDWSYRLLSPTEQLLFRRLGVFVGGCSLEAAEAVIGDDRLPDAVSGLENLAAHSLVRVDDAGGEVRIGMLRPLHDYALRLLEEEGETRVMRERHARYYRHAVDGYPRGTGAGADAWLAKTDREWGNIRLALAWCIQEGDYPGLARFLASVWPLIWLENKLEEAADWMSRLRPHMDELEPEDKGQALYVDAFFGLEVGDFVRARDCARQGVETARQIGDLELEGLCHLIVSGALPAFDLADPEIDVHLSRAIEIFRSRGDQVDLAYALQFLSALESSRGNLEGARAAVREALRLAPSIELVPIEAQAHGILAFVEFLAGDVAAAEANLERAWIALQERPNREVASYVLDGYGWLALTEGRVVEGMTCLGASEALRERLGLRVWPLTEAQLRLLGQLADSFTDPEAQSARRAGRDLSPESAIELVRRPVETSAAA